MSASLVGSEMCIRDSFGPAGGDAEWRRPSRGTVATILRIRTIRSAAAPVSYTHLTLPTICSV
eukprot:10365316-Alexandrium_andersonii.AAC.1